MHKKTSTIVIGIFLLISTLFVIWLIPFNLQESWTALIESANNHRPENAGEMILVYNGAAAIGGLAILISAYVPAFLIFMNSSISLVFSIKNRKSDVKAIRIINYCYDIILALYSIFSVVKILLFRFGIA